MHRSATQLRADSKLCLRLCIEEDEADSRETNTSASQSQSCSSHIFAIGDVAETKGPKMARAGMFQAEAVQKNIAALIKGQQASKVYAPMDVEGSIKLTLGQVSTLSLLASEKPFLMDFRLIGPCICTMMMEAVTYGQEKMATQPWRSSRAEDF
jgi:NADH dehydrogenase FAD-containing subunit